MSVIVTNEDILNFLVQNWPHMAYRPIYPSNLSNLRDKTRINMTLNNIIMLIIVTDAQGFVAVKKFLGQEP